MAATTRFLLRTSRLWFVLLGLGLAAVVSHLSEPGIAQEDKDSATATKAAGKANANPAAEKPKKKKAGNAKPRRKRGTRKPALEALPLHGDLASLRQESRQLDFPAVVSDEAGTIWLAYLDHDGERDVVRLACKPAGSREIEDVGAMSDAGVAHQPALAVTGPGEGWGFWGELGDGDLMRLVGRAFGEGGFGELVTVAESDAAESFADAGTDSAGRIWVAWQSMRTGEAEIFARVLDPETETWSEEIAVSDEPRGQWEPRLSFDEEDNAWILYDSSHGNEFNVVLARVTASGDVEHWPVGATERYEARGDFCATADGAGFWIAGERGRVRWGLDVRGHGNQKGLNAQKEIFFGRFDIDSETFTEHPPGPAGKAGAPVNLPTVGLDGRGRPWLAYRYFERVLWRIGVTRFDPETKKWRVARRLPDSSFGQDRRSQFVRTGDDGLWLGWPSDLRKTKRAQTSGLFLARMDPTAELPDARAAGPPADLSDEPFSPSQKTPERPADDRHRWVAAGTKYGLYWGDVHRHTDVSNCRTGFDGCIVEQFRYAYDIAKLDFLGTSDHTDVGKIYDPYEWWHNQRLHDALHSPGRFNTMYVYEREQRWPWGHRNIVFAQRGGPIVYINRTTYRNSPWQDEFPVKPGLKEIHPTELWQILEDYGKPVTAVSHTGATGMGTDWGAYEEIIDRKVDTVVEIYQGARVSYEGLGAPQPTVGLRPGERYTVASGRNEPQPAPPAPIEQFGRFDAGVYQNALQIGHRLGVFASSDHISQHVSYGGVYCRGFTREGIIEGMRARRTVAATDKIYLEFSCNGKPLGSIFTATDNPALRFRVDGTAPLKRVTLVRNETNWKTFDGIDGTTFEERIVDDAPLDGENRYYLRVEQVDGNMAWCSPVWVTVDS